MEHIPIIDLSKITEKHNILKEEDYRSTAENLFKALSGIGFAYISGHGVGQKIIDRAFAASRQFFELPENVKDKSLKNLSKTYTGYCKPGRTICERREMYDLCGEVRYYPESCPEFGPALQELEEACFPVTKQLLQLMAMALKLKDRNYFIKRSSYLVSPKNNCANNETNLRTLYYPRLSEDMPSGTIRLKEHSDYGFLTILFQDNIGGLQVKSVSGNWIPANPITGTILVNTGDLLEFWSGGIFPATRHRVLIPEEEIKKKVSRQSIALFVHPDKDCIISPLMGNSNEYKPITSKEHLERKIRH